jgi:hypothetical protein
MAKRIVFNEDALFAGLQGQKYYLCGLFLVKRSLKGVSWSVKFGLKRIFSAIQVLKSFFLTVWNRQSNLGVALFNGVLTKKNANCFS